MLSSSFIDKKVWDSSYFAIEGTAMKFKKKLINDL